MMVGAAAQAPTCRSTPTPTRVTASAPAARPSPIPMAMATPVTPVQVLNPTPPPPQPGSKNYKPRKNRISGRDGPDTKLAGYPTAGYLALQLGRIPDIRLNNKYHNDLN